MSYVELADALAYVRTDVDQLLVQSALVAACRGIDTYCQRTFTVPTSATARTFVPDDSYLLAVDDIANTTGLVIVDSGTTISTGYQMEIAPGNPRQTNASGLVEPWQYIRLISGLWTVPCDGEAVVTVTARWGWPAVPEEVKLSALMLTRDLCDGRDTRFGLVAFADAGVARAIRANGQVTAMLEPLRSHRAWGLV